MANVRQQELSDIGFLGGVYVEIEEAFKAASFVDPLTDFLEVLEEQHGEMFDNERDSNGNGWAELAPSTIAAKGHDTILVDTGKMKASLVGSSGDSIRDVIAEGGNQGLVFGTSDEKAHFHQEGTSRMPARPPVGIEEGKIDLLCNALADLLVEQLKG